MAPYSSGGVYVNYLGQEADEGAERVRSAYGPEKYTRLVALGRREGDRAAETKRTPAAKAI
jgi:hypothetical protein